MALLVVIVLIVAVATYSLLVVNQPRIESVDNEWGTVTSERTEIETRIGVDNPRLLRVGDAAADVSYTVSLNDIEVATERKRQIDAAGTESEIAVSTWLDNDDIPAWWASHVERNETTTVRIEPDIVVEYAGIHRSADQWTQTRTVRTDLLEPLQTTESQRFEAGGQTMFIVNETGAQWGNATPNRTPIEASATVTNPMAIPIPITEIRYTIQLNGIVVGDGVAGEQFLLEPERTQTLEANATIDNDNLDEWWVTHLRNNETSTLSVEFDATLEFGGAEREVPLEFLSYERTVQTDMLGSSDTEAAGSADADTAASSDGRESDRTRNRTSTANRS